MADIRTIDLNLLVVLDALLDERNVSRAARRLALTQPTVSGMLARLRGLLGDPLFVRAQRGIVPTPRAQALAAPLKDFLAEGRRLVAHPEFDPATSDITVAISINDYMQEVLLVPFVAHLRREAPNLRLAVRPMRVASLGEAMTGGEIDLAVTIPALAVADWPSRHLYRERYVAAVRSKHPLAASRTITVARFCAFDHILVSPSGGSFTGPTDEALAASGYRRSVRYSVPSFLLVPALLETDDLIAVVPSRLLDGHGAKLASFKPPIEVAGFDVIATWHPRADKDRAHRWLRSRLAEIAKGLRS